MLRFRFQLLFAMVAGALMAALPSPRARGDTVIFSDNFDSENGGHQQYNYDSFTNWTVTGEVDLIGGSDGDSFGLSNVVNHGLFVDLVGTYNQQTNTPGLAGELTSKDAFTFTNGQLYTVSFDLSNNPNSAITDPNNGVNVAQVSVMLDSQTYSHSYTFSPQRPAPPFQTYSFSFYGDGSSSDLQIAETDGKASGLGYPDSQGVFLDNVLITAVPAPKAMVAGALLFCCLGVVQFSRRPRVVAKF